MFNWKVENLELMKMGFDGFEYDLKTAYYTANSSEFKCEKQVSIADKIAFIDSMQDNKMSYIVELNERYEKDKPNLKKDKNGNVRGVSKAAWLKRNDTRNLVSDRDWFADCFRYTGYLADRYEGQLIWVVNKVFHTQLKECFFQEIQYYLEHNADYQVVKSVCENLKNYGYDSGYVLNVADGCKIVTNYDWTIDRWSIEFFSDTKDVSNVELSIEEVRLLNESLVLVEEKYQNLLKAQAEMKQALKDAGADFVRKMCF